MVDYYDIFVLDKPKDGLAYIRYRVEWQGEKVSFSVGIKVEHKKWNQSTQRVINSSTHGPKKIPARRINRRLQEFQDFTNTIFTKYPKIKSKKFRDEFNILRGKRTQITDANFWTIWAEFIKTQGSINSWSDSTYMKFNNLKTNLKEFDKTIQIDKIHDEYLSDFMQFLFRKQQKNTTIYRKLKKIKWFLKWAKNHDYYKGNSDQTFTPKLKAATGKNIVIFLSPEELQQFINYVPTSESHQKIKDIYLFLCFTGLRISDYLRLEKSNFVDHNIVLTTKKTTDNLIIPLNDYSREIAEKYEYDLPKISTQKFNNYLKELAKKAGINTPVRDFYYIGNVRHDNILPKYELLTSHTGRKTFVVNAIILGIPAEVVMSFTGHSDYESMKPYLEIVKKLQEKEMQKFNRPKL